MAIQSLPIVYAQDFRHRAMSGWSEPCVMGCVDDAGVDAGEYVVKFGNNCKRGYQSLVAEIVAWQLAHKLELPVPPASIVMVDKNLAKGVTTGSSEYRSIVNSPGFNFGSSYLSEGFSVWQKNRTVQATEIEIAQKTFLFDLVIENWDRTIHNPNLFRHKGGIVLLDHDAAFSSVWVKNDDSLSWKEQNRPHASQHLFIDQLRTARTQWDWKAIMHWLHQIRAEDFRLIESTIPVEWLDADFRLIQNVVLSKVRTIDSFLRDVQEILQ
jgi:hypothetical protein